MTRPILYSKPDCGQCDMTALVLDRRGIAYETLDVTTDPDALAAVLALGYMQAPVVYVTPKNHWSGFRPDLLATIPKAG